ncbi:PREDICTED: small heat shock protein, chloroplastic-like isoform X2 [Nelumbo nucifera]|uniref:Small heat shock protein, chloroplastic-like isoform X2 n=1 Tax=Nelumbo nucifera TaxID=4432 RepID=A0A1U8A9Y8_NELNU|nr:PREDICTED: small heat shock protein, chloroplastic-like isoform X2 [Nelumbo nucifera]
MASAIALRRAATPSLLNKFLNPVRSVTVVPPAVRSFNTKAQMLDYDDDEHGVDVSRRSDQPVSRRRDYVPNLFSDVLDPFSSTKSLSQVLNLMDQFMENPFLAASRGMGAGTRRGWDVKEDENALYLRMDMPGLGKENVKVSVEQNTLIIKGEGEKESDEEKSGRRYSSRIDLPEKLYKIDQIKAEMKNGVLKVIVPKVKEEERKVVLQVKID